MNDLIDWLLAPFLSAYAAVGLLLAPLVLWSILRNYQLRRLALADYAAASTNPDVANTPPEPRDLRLADLRNLPGIALLLLPPAVFASLYLTWSLAMVPAAMAPVFAGWWWLRLSAKRIRFAHIYAWLALAAPSVAWAAAVVIHIHDYHWVAEIYSTAGLSWWSEDDLAGGRIGIAIAAATIAALSTAAIVAARTPSRRRRAELAAFATVPLAAMIWMSVPAGLLYIAWLIALIGFWTAIRRAEIDPRTPQQRRRETTSQTTDADLRLGNDVADRRSLATQFASAATLSTASLLLLQSLAPNAIASHIAGWLIVSAVGAGAYIIARRSENPDIARDVAIGSQLAAVLVATLLSAGLWAIAGEDISDYYASRFWLLFLTAQAAALVCAVIFGWLTFMLTDDLHRFGAFMLGASWHIAMIFAINIHGIDPTPWELTADWTPSQVISVVIGTTLWVAAIWRTYGDENIHDATVAPVPTTTSPTTQSARPDRPIPHTPTVDTRNETRV